MFEAALPVVSVAAGAVGAIAGFGIGSLLTPLLALQTGTKLAVAAVALPHVVGTLIRFLRLRRHLDRWLFLRFGLTSAFPRTTRCPAASAFQTDLNERGRRTPRASADCGCTAAPR